MCVLLLSKQHDAGVCLTELNNKGLDLQHKEAEVRRKVRVHHQAQLEQHIVQ